MYTSPSHMLSEIIWFHVPYVIGGGYTTHFYLNCSIVVPFIAGIGNMSQGHPGHESLWYVFSLAMRITCFQ